MAARGCGPARRHPHPARRVRHRLSAGCHGGPAHRFGERTTGDADGPAPRLADVRLPVDAATAMWAKVCGDVARMLSCGIVHGDLSAYNLLLFRGQAVFIDLPQALSTSASDAYEHFARDLRNLSRWFERAGVATQCERLIDTLWRGS